MIKGKGFAEDTIAFNLAGSEDSPVLNPCFVIRHWGSAAAARVEIDRKKQTSEHMRQGIIRDTDGTRTMVIWLEQTTTQKTSFQVY